MNARSLLLAAAVLALAGGGIFQARVIVNQRVELQALQKLHTDTERLAAALRRTGDAIHAELKAAEQQLEALPAPTFLDAAMAAREHETKAWLARVKQLKRLFEERPDQCIPEMQWLTDEDWLRVAKRASFADDHGTRKALGDLRNQAKEKFFKRAMLALRAFAKNANGEPPSSIMAFASSFETPVDAAILERYEIVKGDTYGGTKPGELTLREKRAVDEDYDSRWNATSNGQNYGRTSLGAPYAWIPDFWERTARAYRAYAEAHGGDRPSGTTQALPYFDPPIDPIKAALLVRFERERQQ